MQVMDQQLDLTYVQSTNTPTGNQFVIGTNGTGTQLDFGYASAGKM